MLLYKLCSAVAPMRITFNKLTALQVIRSIRGRFPHLSLESGRCGRSDIIAPDPTPMKRWTKRSIEVPELGIRASKGLGRSLYVAVDDPSARLQMGCVENTLYSNEGSVPYHSFIEVCDGVAVSSPELLFAEMGSLMDFAHLVLLGHELCGTFSRDAADPRNGAASFGLRPATSLDRMMRFLKQARHIRGANRARAAIRYVSENAWSPVESVISAVINMPVSELGYGLERCVLNQRVDTCWSSKVAGRAGSRVPDILFAGTHVGLNYDGRGHLDLQGIAETAQQVERGGDGDALREELNAVISEVRAKAVDDLRRNRELAASGYIVLPVTKEDLYIDGGLDRVVSEAFAVVDRFGGEKAAALKRPEISRELSHRRSRLIRSLLPNR